MSESSQAKAIALIHRLVNTASQIALESAVRAAFREIRAEVESELSIASLRDRIEFLERRVDGIESPGIND